MKPLSPQTRAEATDYRETSSHADVLAFLATLKAGGAPIRLESLGKSFEGREIPLVVAGTGPLVVYIQANIHAGEVEGKEASLMLLRDLLKKDPKKLLRKLTLLVAPIYNADGNEKWGDGKVNRGHQDGPARVGVRTNGQGLDLNRDCVKAESPEMRGVLEKVYLAYDPDVVFDLHTTNGTRHGFDLTDAPPLHPNTPPGILTYSRDALLPGVHRRLLKERGWRFFDYGNAERRGAETVWASFGEEARYVTNYAGLRGAVAILSEAVSFLPFKFRVETTYRFVEATLEAVARDSAKIRALRADRSLPKELGVRFELASRGRDEEIRLEVPLPESQIDHMKAPTQWEVKRLPVWDRFAPTRTARIPKFYLVPKSLGSAIELLLRHGIPVERLSREWSGKAEVFTISERVQARPFQSHALNRLEGTWAMSDANLPAGTLKVSTDGPLGRLAFHLLEPESLDGLAAWNFLDDSLAVGAAYPIVKAF